MGQSFFFLVAIDIILVYGKQTLHQESGFYQVTSIIFLTERFHLSRIAIPPVRICSVKAVCFFEEGNDTFHSCQTFFAGDVATVYSGKNSHNTETTAARSNYIGVVLRIYPVYMIPFGRKPAVGFGTLPKVEKGATLNGVHQGVIRKFGTGGGLSASLVLTRSCRHYEAEKHNIER